MSEPIAPDEDREPFDWEAFQEGMLGEPQWTTASDLGRLSIESFLKENGGGQSKVSLDIVPPDCVVVRRDDLLTALSAWNNDERMPREVYDRLWAKLP